MTATAETLEAVILSGPRRGEIVTLPPGTPTAPNAEDVEALDGALDNLNRALERVSSELRAALQSLKPKPQET